MQDLTVKKNVKILSEEPFVGFLRNFLNAQECQELIDEAKDDLKRAKVLDQRKGERFSKGRTNQSCFLKHDSSLAIKNFQIKLFEELGVKKKHLTQFQILKYSTKEKYSRHFDAYTQEFLNLKKVNQRKVTFLAYLNEVDSGGQTYFPLLDISVPPSKGGLLIFNNCFGNSIFTHPKSIHGSKPVRKGSKWALNFWSSTLIFSNKVS